MFAFRLQKLEPNTLTALSIARYIRLRIIFKKVVSGSNNTLGCTSVVQVGAEGSGGGGRRNMSEYTSREEIHMAAMEGVKSSQLKKLVGHNALHFKTLLLDTRLYTQLSELSDIVCRR